MLTTRDLLAAAKSAQGIPSNYRLARVMNVPDTTVQRWNTGRGQPDDAMCIRLAELAGLDPAQVVASIRAEREAQGPLHDFWAALALRLQGATAAVQAAVLGLILSLFVGGGPDGGAQAATLASPEHGSGSVYYVNWRAALRAWLASACGLVEALIYRRYAHPRTAPGQAVPA